MKNRIKKTGIIILCLSIGLILHSACKDTSATIRTNTGKNYLDGEDLYCTLREADFWKE